MRSPRFKYTPRSCRCLSVAKYTNMRWPISAQCKALTSWAQEPTSLGRHATLLMESLEGLALIAVMFHAVVATRLRAAMRRRRGGPGSASGGVLPVSGPRQHDSSDVQADSRPSKGRVPRAQRNRALCNQVCFESSLAWQGVNVAQGCCAPQQFPRTVRAGETRDQPSPHEAATAALVNENQISSLSYLSFVCVMTYLWALSCSPQAGLWYAEGPLGCSKIRLAVFRTELDRPGRPTTNAS